MRTRRRHHQCRMMCLVVLCAWSFAIMLYLWKQIKERDEYKTLRFAIRRQTDEFGIEIQPKAIADQRKQNGNDIDDWLDLEAFLKGLQRSKNSQIKVKQRRKAKIDYGNDRDLDVEGVNDFMMWYENFQNTNPQLPTLPRQRKCTKPIENVAFLKTHFTGSDVITNILNRYGDLNNLNVALPSDGLSTFFWPMRFQWKYIDITMLNGSLPNIISNHARYNNDVMDNILNPGSIYVTIIRDPVTQLETTFNYLGFGGLLQVTNTSDQLKKFLENPKYYIQGVVSRKRFKDTLNLIKNGQFFDLGLRTTEYHRKNIIKTTIQELHDKFSVVIVYEYLDESLVLLKRRLCWQLDDILYLKLHHTSQNTWNRPYIQPDLADMIRQWNAADTMLYEFFNKTLWEEIKFEGKEFWEEVSEFKRMQYMMENDCVKDNGDKFTLVDVPNEPAKTKHEKVLKLRRGYTTKPSELYHLRTRSPESKRHAGIKAKEFKLDNATMRDILLYTNQIKKAGDKGDMETSGDHRQTESNQYESNSSVVIGNEAVNNNSLHTWNHAEASHKTEYIKFPIEGSGQGVPFVNAETAEKTNVERMLSAGATPWNSYLCKKLLMSELEYLDYFRRKHAYAKAEFKNTKKKR